MNTVDLEKRNLEKIEFFTKKYKLKFHKNMTSLMDLSTIYLSVEERRIGLRGVLRLVKKQTVISLYTLPIKFVENGFVDVENVIEDLNRLIVLCRQLKLIQDLKDLELKL